MTLDRSFGRSSLHLAVFGTQKHTVGSVRLRQNRAQTSGRSVACSSTPTARIRWRVPYGRPNLPALCDVMLRRCSLILCTFSTFYWASCGGTTSTIVNRTLSMSDSPEALKICFLQWHCHRKPFSAFHAFTVQSSRILKQNLKDWWPVKSDIRISWSTP